MWLAPDQSVMAAENAWIRLLALQPDAIRLSVTSSARIHLGRRQSAEDVLLRVTLTAVKEHAADIDVAIAGRCASLHSAAAESQHPESNWNSIFVTLRVGEAVDVVAGSPLDSPPPHIQSTAD